jgi:type VI secretion system secreted protein VgrG
MNVVLEAGMSITLKAGAGFIVVGPAGVTISGVPILLNSGGSAGSGSGASPEAPKEPQEADKADPGRSLELHAEPEPYSPAPPQSFFATQVQILREAAQAGTPFCEKCAEASRAQMGS